jgi:predicted RNase H-like HicB family nuclease
LAARLIEEDGMSVYFALVHKEDKSCYGVSFPDMLGHVTAGDTIDEAIEHAHDLLFLLRETWKADSGEEMPQPSSLSAIQEKMRLDDHLKDAVIVAVSTDHRPSFKVAAE